ncbi:hypothetical protein DE146DRAFT_759600 [Phaeosphaeria sp. MPI-PUGE-AT-0046c]|nr:hypothetical protein DE146DRAFT_759600 [Phaeosphaeria sp. MPI-PUGE-AT-0046c]
MSSSTRKDPEHLFTSAPSADFASSVTENITAVEIGAFLPNFYRAHHVAFRLASNGVTNSLASDIVNHHRESPEEGDVTNNTLCKMLQTAMRTDGHYKYLITTKDDSGEDEVVVQEWSIFNHKKNNTKHYWGVWDPNLLTFSNVPIGSAGNVGVATSVNFKTLANGYAIDNPELDFLFPDHFGMMCDIIGRTQVQDKHRDGPTFLRWLEKRKQEKKSARAVALTTGRPKTFPMAIRKAEPSDIKDKANKIRAKVAHAFKSGRFDLGPDGSLILDKRNTAMVSQTAADDHHCNEIQASHGPYNGIRPVFSRPSSSGSLKPHTPQHVFGIPGFGLDDASSVLVGSNRFRPVENAYRPVDKAYRPTSNAYKPTGNPSTARGIYSQAAPFANTGQSTSASSDPLMSSSINDKDWDTTVDAIQNQLVGYADMKFDLDMEDLDFLQ